MAIHILGIRHHGPGSARGVRNFLQSVKPDIVLVEGPPEADGLLKWVGHPELKPPVALLCYQPDAPQRSVFYPFAEFSPEWQAILYAQTQQIPVRFMDLPISNQFELDKVLAASVMDEAAALIARLEAAEAAEAAGLLPAASPGGNPDTDGPQLPVAGAETDIEPSAETPADPESLHRPTYWLAKAAGYSDEEKWWEHMFEYRVGEEPVFEAVEEAMSALRDHFPDSSRFDKSEKYREAFMRQTIRNAAKEMYTEIAVICGAWHVPALTQMPSRKEDTDLLKGLPKAKTECTWIPWTYERLSFFSGYGAGIHSPGWYDHIWNYPEDDGTRWMSLVAGLFREKQMDVSVAHVMEAVRLAQSLAALRQLPRTGLEELNEATLSVICQGEDIRMGLIREKLIVSDRIGEVPVDIPKPPLQVDIEKTQKRLRLAPAADWKDYTLDLRKEADLEKSIFLHRLRLLDINWGTLSEASGKGTFKEQWRLQWDPALSIDIIEKGRHGNTVEEAASVFVIDKTYTAQSLREVSRLLAESLPAELPYATDVLIHQINNLAAASGDVIQLMEVIPGLVTVSRYGNVRNTDADQVLDILDSMITRVCISLPAASSGIDESSAASLLELFYKMNDSVNTLQQESQLGQWQQTLQLISGDKNSAPLIGGYATRLLFDHKIPANDELVRAFSFAMSGATPPASAAAWLEGFLRGSGSLLLIDNALWDVVNNWISQLGEETFTEVLPLLRRSFARFSQPERRKLGEKVKHGNNRSPIAVSEAGFDHERARHGIPVVLKILGLPPLSNGPEAPSPLSIADEQ
jgi:hypothetical protein